MTAWNAPKALHRDFFFSPLNKILWLLKETAFIYFMGPNHSLMPILVHLWHSAPWKLQHWAQLSCVPLCYCKALVQKAAHAPRDKLGSFSSTRSRSNKVKRFMDPYLPKFWCHWVGKACTNKITLPNILFLKCISRQHVLKGLDMLCWIPLLIQWEKEFPLNIFPFK